MATGEVTPALPPGFKLDPELPPGFKLDSADAAPEPEKKTPLSKGREFSGAVAEPLMAMGSGLVGSAAGNIAGMGAAPLHALGAIKTDPSAIKERVQGALTYQPRTEAGKSPYNPLNAIPRAIGAPFEWAGEKAEHAIEPPPTARGGMDDPVAELRRWLARGTGEAIKQSPALLGLRGAKALEGAPALRAPPTMKDAVRSGAQESGYITPPESGVKSGLAGLAGKSKIEKILSEKNTDNATKRLGNEVGSPEGTGLSKEEFTRLKGDAGASYEAMKSAVGPKLDMKNTSFKEAMEETLSKIDSSLEHNAEVNRPLLPAARLIRSYLKKMQPIDVPAGKLVDERGSPLVPATKKAPESKMSTDEVLHDIQSLRAQAKKDFFNKNGELGQARLGVAHQLENLFEENLAKTGSQQALTDFRKARERFAKIYLLERIVNDATGKVDLSKLASLSDTKAYKGVLTGEFEKAADFAKTYRKAAQKSTGEAAPRLTVFDGMFALSSIAAGHPWAAEIGGRLGIPAMAERGMLQNKPNAPPSGIPPQLMRLLGIGGGAGIQSPPQ